MDERTDIGPMINAKGREKVERHVGEAIRKGAKVVAGGERYGERGFFYKPTILTGVEPSMTVMRDETFGPVVPVVRVDTLDEAIEQANSVPYGLGANVYTRDFEKMLKCMREIRAGTVWINDPLTDNDAAPSAAREAAALEGSSAARASKPSRNRSTSTSTPGWRRRSGGTPTAPPRSQGRGRCSGGSPELVAPGVYRVDAIRLSSAINVLLLEDDDGWTLVDTGTPNSAGRIQEAITALGSGPEDLKRIFLTHHHPDHAGGVQGLIEWAPQAELGAPEHEAEIISGRRARTSPRAPSSGPSRAARTCRPRLSRRC